jgi:putative chitinase
MISLHDACAQIGNTKPRVAAFLAQLGHESAQFKAVKENLNYSAPALVKVFPKYFPDDATAIMYARQPEKIANRVYANRMGNGTEASGEGWKYRGRGYIQCTGKNNYTACGKYLGWDLVNHPELLELADGAVKSAVWYWTSNNLNRFCDVGDMKGLTKAINGGYIGLEDRIAHYNQLLAVLQ